MASSAEQAIRVTAQGEFGQLQRGLKDLQGDLKNVLGEVDKGARKGGIFDDTQLRALDVYRRRFKETLADLNNEFDKQADIVETLNAKMKKAYAWEREELKEQIRQRRENLDVIDRTRQQIEQAYQRRNTEAQGYGSSTNRSGSGTSGGGNGSSGGTDSSFAMLGASSLLSRSLSLVGTIGKVALGLAGAGSILGMATESYQLAKSREVDSLDLAQRLRGHGFSGSNTKMFDEVGAVGRRNGMGYSQAESWQLQDAYTSEAGSLGPDGQLALQKFSRGYGLDATATGSLAGNAKQLGGVSSPKQFADMIATSVEKSGMTPRILEVMRTSNTLLQNLNTTFKDGSTSQIIAYQTTLDRLGIENGMTRLTGAQGANVIGGLGGIYQPDNEKWKWTGITALQKYNPEKYNKMGLYDLESSFEDGLQNPDNVPAMVKHLKEMSGGNNEYFKRMVQGWLTEGGFKATKNEVTELDKVTNGFSAFDQGKLEQVLGTDSGAKYDTERKDEYGQQILDIEAEFSKNLTDIGGKILPIVTNVKDGINDLYGLVSGATTFSEVFEKIVKLFEDTGVGDFGTGAKEPTSGTESKDLGLGTAAGIVVGGGVAGRVGYKIYERFRGDGTELTEEGPTRSRAEQYQRLQNRFTASEGVSGSASEGVGSASEGVGTRLGRFVNRIRGLGRGTNTLNGVLNVIPAGIAGYEAEKENPDASFIDKLSSALEKLIPFDWGKTNFSAESMGDSDILSTTSVKPGSLANLSKSGVADIGALSSKGQESLESLKLKGYLSYVTIESITTAKLNEIKQIHQSYFDRLSIREGIGGITGNGTTGNPLMGDTDVRNPSGITGVALNGKLKGGLAGYGNDYLVAGQKYQIDPAFLAAVSMHETGNGRVISGNNVGGMMGSNGPMEFGSIEEGIDAMAKNLKNLYIDDGLTTPEAIQKRYAPIGAGNDPTNLNNNWLSGVTGFYNSLTGGGAKSSSGAYSGGVFKNWQSKITSKFGADRGDHAHSGLDIDGEQGDLLNALAGGRITGLTIDDGSQYDSDGKGKNTNMGGTEMMITMPDGSAYSYSHMSKINPEILSEWLSGNHDIDVNAGDNLGNMGGDIDEPGSGSSTTGSHLHLGYRDADGVAQNPEDLLNSFNVGNSSMLSQSSHITLDVNLIGDNVSQLNTMTIQTLKNLIQPLVQQGIEAYKRQQLAMNPTVAGW